MNDFPYVTVGELADLLAVQSWRISRLAELGLLPDFHRAGGRRMIARTQIPAIVAALADRGWLPVPDQNEAQQ